MYNHIKIVRDFIYCKEVFLRNDKKNRLEIELFKLENGNPLIQSVAHVPTIDPLIGINCFYIVVKPAHLCMCNMELPPI